MADINVKVSFGATAESAQSTAEEALRYGQQTLLPLINTNQNSIMLIKNAINTNQANIATNKIAIATNAAAINANKANIAVIDELAAIQSNMNYIKLHIHEGHLYVIIPSVSTEISKRTTHTFTLLRSTNGKIRYTPERVADLDKNIWKRRIGWTEVGQNANITLQGKNTYGNLWDIRVAGICDSDEYEEIGGSRTPQNLGEDLECANSGRGIQRICFFNGQYVQSIKNNGGTPFANSQDSFCYIEDWDDVSFISKNVKLGLRVSTKYTTTNGNAYTFCSSILPFAINRWYEREELYTQKYLVPRFSVGRWAY